MRKLNRDSQTRSTEQRVRAKTDKEAFKYIEIQEQFENFQKVQKFLLEIDNNPSDFLKSSGGC